MHLVPGGEEEALAILKDPSASSLAHHALAHSYFRTLDPVRVGAAKLPVLLEELRHWPSHDSCTPVAALGELENPSEEIVNVLEEHLNDPDPLVRSAAARGLPRALERVGRSIAPHVSRAATAIRGATTLKFAMQHADFLASLNRCAEATSALLEILTDESASPIARRAVALQAHQWTFPDHRPVHTSDC